MASPENRCHVLSLGKAEEEGTNRQGAKTPEEEKGNRGALGGWLETQISVLLRDAIAASEATD